MRPVTLPHHRTCGFPHPAVETSSYIAVCQKFRKVPPRDRRRQARRSSTASARCTLRETARRGRALRFQIPTQLPFSPLPSSVWFLPPFAPPALPGFFATTASADCSHALTRELSPGKVQNLSPRAVRLPGASRMTFGLRCSQPARRPHPASLPVRVPTVESLLRASFSFTLRLRLALRYGCRHQLRRDPFISLDSAHAGHTGAGNSARPPATSVRTSGPVCCHQPSKTRAS